MSGSKWFTGAQLSEAARQKLEIAHDFIQAYSAARRGLTTLGILRSERNLQGDYAEWVAAQLLDLELAASGVQKGYDAVDKQGRKYQIKARLVSDLSTSTSFDFRSAELDFDYFVGVFLSPTLDLLGVIRVPHEVVQEIGRTNQSSFRLRWTRQSASDTRIERLFWDTPTEEADAGNS
jgi:hypothetical protein